MVELVGAQENLFLLCFVVTLGGWGLPHICLLHPSESLGIFGDFGKHWLWFCLKPGDRSQPFQGC